MFRPKDKVQFNEDASYIRGGVDLSDRIGTVIRVYPDYFEGRSTIRGDLLIVDFDGERDKVPAMLLHIYTPGIKTDQAPADTVSINGEEFIRDLATSLDLDKILEDHKDNATDFILYMAALGSKVATILFGVNRFKTIELDKETLEKTISDILSPDMLREIGGEEMDALTCLQLAVDAGPYFIDLIEHYFPAVDNE